MKEAKEKFPSTDVSLDECCSIAESMIQEMQMLRLVEVGPDEPTVNCRQKGSLKRRLMRQIEQALQMSMIG